MFLEKRVTRNLRRVRKAFDKVGWTTGAVARDITGRSISIYDKKAVSFCMAGLVYKVIDNEKKSDEVITELRKNMGLYGPVPISLFNDEYCKDRQDVEEWLDRAIENSK